MTNNGNFDLSDVPRLRKSGAPKDLMCARGALLSAAENIEANSIGAGRAMTATELTELDAHLAFIRDISEDLAEYKRHRIADCAGSGLAPVFPF